MSKRPHRTSDEILFEWALQRAKKTHGAVLVNSNDNAEVNTDEHLATQTPRQIPLGTDTSQHKAGPANPTAKSRTHIEHEGDLLKESQVAELLNVSVKTIRNWRQAKKGLPYIKVGAAVRYKPEDVQGWLEQHKKGK